MEVGGRRGWSFLIIFPMCLQRRARAPDTAGVASDCDGCLGSRRCWVCLGTGNADTLRQLGVCPSCGGSARCAYCDPKAPMRYVDVTDDAVVRANVEHAPQREP